MYPKIKIWYHPDKINTVVVLFNKNQCGIYLSMKSSQHRTGTQSAGFAERAFLLLHPAGRLLV
jgi:hypothetical protein